MLVGEFGCVKVLTCITLSVDDYSSDFSMDSGTSKILTISRRKFGALRSCGMNRGCATSL